MFLVAVNYPNEVNQEIFLSRDVFDVKFFNEPKWFMFGYKLLKFLTENKNKYDLLFHFGLCWTQNQDEIWKLYKIDRTFLFGSNIIENQRFKNWSFSFQNIPNSNIATKFTLWPNPQQIYDFAQIFDLETFWVAGVSNQIWIPVFSVKWVSDTNDTIWWENIDETEFLLNPEMKRKKKDFYIEKLQQNINIVNHNLNDFFENEFLDFYKKFSKDKDFKKSFYI